MPRRPRANRLFALTAALAGLSISLAACGPGASPSIHRDPTAPPTTLKVGLGYIPSVQFAPFYLAQQKGYYRDAGLDVTFENKIDPDLVTLVGQGALDLGVADGTSVIPARSQGIPVTYIATIYGTYPSIVFAKRSSGIASAADLAGRKIGIPGRYGSSWIMLQALLDSVGLAPDDVELVEYPDFGQGVAVQQGVVDAATGFANNEPVQLELAGAEAVVLHVDDVVALPGPGLITSTSQGDSKHDAIRAFIEATLRAMDEIATNPQVGLDAAIAAVPELAAQRDTQAAILEATIATWRDPTGALPFGTIDVDGWLDSIEYLTSLGLVPNPVSLSEVTSAGFGMVPPEPDTVPPS